jgi:DNA topoisomerase I
MLDDRNAAELAIVDPRDAAESVGLVYVSDEEPGIRRRKAGKGFSYQRQGKAIKDAATLKRIKSLAIPPAWTDVWICSKANGHIQATGRDAKNRKQYRYHPEFRGVREGVKFEHLMQFARLLPKIRAKVSEHMALRGLPREKVLATTVIILKPHSYVWVTRTTPGPTRAMALPLFAIRT